eukprot:1138838-Pelagomonas_calceolata.AAC.4
MPATEPDLCSWSGIPGKQARRTEVTQDEGKQSQIALEARNCKSLRSCSHLATSYAWIKPSDKPASFVQHVPPHHNGAFHITEHISKYSNIRPV